MNNILDTSATYFSCRHAATAAFRLSVTVSTFSIEQFTITRVHDSVPPGPL